MKAVSAHYVEGKVGGNWHDAYGVWFAGKFRASVNEKHKPKTWVCLDTKPEKLETGEHEVEVCGRSGVLLLWRAQGYIRGVVISSDEMDIVESAKEVMELAPWSFQPIFELGRCIQK